MSIKLAATFTTGLALALALSVPAHLSAQRPASEPRLAVPRTELPVAQAPGQPTTTPVVTQPGSQTTAAAPADTTPAPAPVTQVTGGASGVTQLGTPQPTTASSSQAATADVRSFTASKSMLTLEGVQIAAANRIEGGTATSDVVIEKVGSDNIRKKHLAGVKYEDISFSTGLESKALMDWIASMMTGKHDRKSGSILGLDYNNTIRSERTFTNALPTAVTIPTLDASSKDAAAFTVTLAPEYTRLIKGSGTRAQSAAIRPPKWTTAGFRFEMAGLDGSKVNRIESFTIKQTVVENPVGELRDYQKEPGRVDYPSLKLSLAESSAQTWLDWHNDFVINGNNGDDKERDGAIVFLSPTLTELGRVKLFHCGVYRLGSQAQDGKAEMISRVTAELYCERMELVTKSS